MWKAIALSLVVLGMGCQTPHQETMKRLNEVGEMADFFRSERLKEAEVRKAEQPHSSCSHGAPSRQSTGTGLWISDDPLGISCYETVNGRSACDGPTREATQEEKASGGFEPR